MVKTTKVVYVVPEASSKGGMTSIVQMFYQDGLFERNDRLHFNTSFVWGNNKLIRFLESLLKRVSFTVTLIHYKADLVFIMSSSNWGFYDKIIYALIARILGVKVILNPVGGYFKEFYNSTKINKALVKLSLRIPHCLVVSSGLWHDYFAKEFHKVHIVNIPNPVYMQNIVKASSPSDELIKVLFVSRLVKDKGIFDLIKIIKVVLNQSINFKFIIIGEGNLKEFVEKELESYIDSRQVEVMGFVSEQQKITALSTSNVFLFTSHFEVLPISILEAMAARLLIITTNVGSIPEAVKENINGYLFNPSDVKGIASCLLSLVSKKNILERFGQNSYKICLQKFNLKSVLNRHDVLFEELRES